MRILKHERCYGLQITNRIELWLALPHYTIKPHHHPNCDSTILHIFSNASLSRVRCGVDKTINIKPFQAMLKSFLLLGSDIHWFTTGSLPLLFINIKHKASAVSPAHNLKLTIT